jgi:DNA-binding transcriptional MerR regulator/methylmalonyl-CoA mutase cobalamin-binding subunit
MSFEHLPAPSSISDVERDTGVAKETLRVWERRYAFPQPLRDAQGERLYPAEQVAKLRLVKRLMDLGYRPGKMMSHNESQLQELAERTCNTDLLQQQPDLKLDSYLSLCKTHQIDVLRGNLTQAQLELGLKRFVIDVVAPLTTQVGMAWARGDLTLFGEHLYTETVQAVLRTAIFGQQAAAGIATPRILLTTLPQERHGIGLLMAEALFVSEGAHCISLGVQTPLLDIVEAAHSQHADVVALSFSSAMNARQAMQGLSALRAALPATTALWAGGSCSALSKRLPALVRVLSLGEVGAIVTQWRNQAKVGTPD